MRTPIQLSPVNFSRDLRGASLGAAAIAGILALAALAATAVLVVETARSRAAQERMLSQARVLEAEAATLRQQQSKSEPQAAAIGELRQRIVSLNALDFGQAPPVTSVLSALEELMPPAVALQNLDYDRTKGTLEIVAVSASSEDLTNFFDIASRSRSFKAVRLIDKKQAGASDEGVSLFQVRLSISLASGESRA